MEKLTKKDKFKVLMGVVEGSALENKEEMIAFIEREVELLSKKSTSKSKAQVEADERAERLYAEMVGLEGFLVIKDIQAGVADEEIKEFSNQRMSALLKKLIDAGKVEKSTEGKSSVFKAIK